MQYAYASIRVPGEYDAGLAEWFDESAALHGGRRARAGTARRCGDRPRPRAVADRSFLAAVV